MVEIMKENFDLSVCEFIEESMWFYTYIDFCDNAIFIKKKYESLKPLEKKLYRWYVYANIHMDICFKNGIWDYLNGYSDLKTLYDRKQYYKLK